ncbi:MAG: hypothetical protein C4299_03880 [Thermoleophilia bacterium]
MGRCCSRPLPRARGERGSGARWGRARCRTRPPSQQRAGARRSRAPLRATSGCLEEARAAPAAGADGGEAHRPGLRPTRRRGGAGTEARRRKEGRRCAPLGWGGRRARPERRRRAARRAPLGGGARTAPAAAARPGRALRNRRPRPRKGPVPRAAGANVQEQRGCDPLCLGALDERRRAIRHELHTVFFKAVTGVLHHRQPLVRNASAIATELIRQAIVDGRLSPGQRLKEEELARELGISRTPVREALLILQAEGLVEAAPNRGATVRVHTAEDLEDLYQLRALLEGYAARRAATRMSDEIVAALWSSCERFEAVAKDGEVVDLVKENLFFHNAILETAGSARLAAMVRKVIELPLVYRSYIWYTPEQRLISAHYHRQIARAFEARDAERAELLMKEHVFEARDLLVAHVRELEGSG